VAANWSIAASVPTAAIPVGGRGQAPYRERLLSARSSPTRSARCITPDERRPSARRRSPGAPRRPDRGRHGRREARLGMALAARSALRRSRPSRTFFHTQIYDPEPLNADIASRALLAHLTPRVAPVICRLRAVARRARLPRHPIPGAPSYTLLDSGLDPAQTGKVTASLDSRADPTVAQPGNRARGRESADCAGAIALAGAGARRRDRHPCSISSQ